MTWLYAIVGLVAVQRIAEALYARRNTRLLLAAGATETAPQQHGYFIALHALWLLAIALTSARTTPNWALIAIFMVLQGLRVWVLVTLGRYWTTRIITPTGVAPIRRGPYRFVRHPNYLIVAAELAVLPLAFGNMGVALACSAVNGALLAWRISAENRALNTRP